MVALPANAGAGRIARKAVVGLAAVLIGLVLAGTAAILRYGYLAAIEDAKASTVNLATTLDEHTRKTLRVVDVTLQGLVDRFSSEGYLDEMNPERLMRTLANRASVTGEILSLFVVGPDGRLITDSRGGRTKIDLSDREYFRHHRNEPDHGLHISEPVMSAGGRGRVIVLSYKLAKPDGTFVGIVAASVSSQYFEDFYRTIDIGTKGVIALRTRLGAYVARFPTNRASLTGADAGSDLVAAVVAGRFSGTEDYLGRNDGVRRMSSFRAIDGTPYVIAVGRAHEDFLAPWRNDVLRYSLVALLVGFAVAISAWYLLQQIDERERTSLAVLRAERAAIESVRQSQMHERDTRLRLETILNCTPLGCMVADAELRMTYWNPAAEKIFGYSFEDVKGRTPLETGIVLTDPGLLESRHERLRRGESFSQSTAKNRAKDGRTITCEWTSTPLMGSDGAFGGALFIVQDVTERLTNQEVLLQSAKMDALGQLTGGVAHDFNNLLTVVMANLEMIVPGLVDRPADVNSVRAALEAAKRGGELTRQLLAFSRRQTLEPRVVMINDLVGGMTKLLARTIGEDIEMKLDVAPDIWPVRIDPTQLDSALANLVVNARDAMPNGGKLMIATTNATLDAAYAAQHAEVVAGDYVCISVTDTGVGMPKEVVDRVFEPFFTTKELGKGTGLGMSMVFGFVKQSGGHIKVYSEVGLGTTIRLFLPRAPGVEAAPEALETARPESAMDGETILVVEDDEAVRDALTQGLRLLGYHVLEAGNGRAALAILDREQRIDLLFTDMVMPGGITGVELSHTARTMRPELKVLLTSGYAAPALAAQMQAVEGALLISKPYRITDVAREVRSVLDRPRLPQAVAHTQ